MVRLEYDAQYLSASVEKGQMTDGIMKTQWKDNIYRIILRLNDNVYFPEKGCHLGTNRSDNET